MGFPGMRYSSDAHVPRSISLQRSEQKGLKGFSSQVVIFLHTGQVIFILSLSYILDFIAIFFQQVFYQCVWDNTVYDPGDRSEEYYKGADDKHSLDPLYEQKISQWQLRYIMKKRADQAYSDSAEEIFKQLYAQTHGNHACYAAAGAEDKGRAQKSAYENRGKHNPYQSDQKGGPESVEDKGDERYDICEAGFEPWYRSREKAFKAMQGKGISGKNGDAMFIL